MSVKCTEHLGDLDIAGRIILRWLLKNTVEFVNWIHLAQDRVQWWACVEINF
jgi:hypothetical protein